MDPSTFLLILLLNGNSGLLVGPYRGIDNCEYAGRMATKRKEIEFLCLPGDKSHSTAVRPKATVPLPRPAPQTKVQ